MKTKWPKNFEIKTQEDFEEAWRRAKARDEREKAAWEALSEDEKKRRMERYDAAFRYRISSPIDEECIDTYGDYFHEDGSVK